MRDTEPKRMLLVDPKWETWKLHFEDSADAFKIPLIVETAIDLDQANVAMRQACFDVVFTNDRRVCELAQIHGAKQVFFSGRPESVSEAKAAGFMGIDKGRFSIAEVAEIIRSSHNDRCHEEEGT